MALHKLELEYEGCTTRVSWHMAGRDQGKDQNSMSAYVSRGCQARTSLVILLSKSTDPQLDSRWYTFGFIPDVVTNCKVLPG